MENREITILLVEDDPIVSMDQSSDLRKFNYIVQTAFTGEEAVDFVLSSKEKPDLILMDIDLGDGIDGTVAAEEILKHFDIPIVFLSSHTEPEVVQKTEKITSYGYVVKNTGSTVLNASIKMAFRLFDEKVKVRDHQNRLSAALEELQTANEDLERAYEEMEQTNEELFQSNEQLEASHREILERDRIINKTIKQLKRAQRVGQIGSWEFNFNTGKIDISEESKILYGLKEDRVYTIQDVQKIPLPEYRDMLDRALKNLVEKGIPYDVEFKIKRESDSEERFIHSIAEFDKNRNCVVGVIQNITARKEIENTLRESELKFKSYIENAPIGVFVTDKNGVYIDVNSEAEEITGYSRSELLGMNLIELIYEDDVPIAVESFQKMVEGIKNVSVELRYVNKNNDVRYWHVNAVDLPNDRYLGFAKDITDRKINEFALIESEKNLKNILENSTNMYYSHTTDHILTYLSPQVEEVLGYTPEEAMVKWTELATDCPMNDAAFNSTIRAIETGERQPTYELELLRKDGRKIIVEVREIPLVENGKTVAIMGSLVDITERKIAEQNLLDERDRFFTVLDSIDDVIYVSDPESYELLYVNNAVKKLYDSDVIGKKCYEVLQSKSSPCDFCTNHIIIEENPDAPYIWEFQNENLDKWFRCFDKSIKWMDGRIVRFELAIDISNQKKNEILLEKSLAENERLLLELQHRVKNSFVLIDSIFSLNLNSLSDTKSESRKALEDIRLKISAISEIYAIISSNSSIESLKLDEYLKKLLSSFSKAAADVSFKESIDEVTIPVKRAVPIGLILSELITNSMKYAFNETSEKVIEIKLVVVDKSLSISYSDNGVGLPEKIISGGGSLGVNLIRALSKQIKADLVFKNSGGCYCELNLELD